MFGKYWYRSGINTTMKGVLKGIVDDVISLQQHKKDDLWLDIACNDGTLLSYVPKDYNKLGIDPAEDSFLSESKKIADDVVQDFFSYESYQRSKFKDVKAKVITCIAMFYDLDEPLSFLKDVHKVLDDDGLFVLQMSYTPLMLKQHAFDNICHEHVYYWSLASIQKVLSAAKLKVVDVQLNDTNGGSFRLYVKKKNSNVNSFSTAPYRDVCNVRIESLLNWESKLKMTDFDTWNSFFNQINKLKVQTVNFLKREKAKGKVICGYGASTKGNTLLQYFGIDNTLITAIAERSSYKFGHKTVGTNIPIISEKEMRKLNPDYLLVLPWHFIAEFIEREKNFLENGGKFIVPCPEFKIISNSTIK
jgi:SAM-dependent methyltransferase